MTRGPADDPNDAGAPSPERLAAAVRRGLGLGEGDPVELREVGEFSNINYVYRVEAAGRSLYLKAVPERPKRFPARMPPERVFSEAEGLRRFRRLAAGAVVVPEVLFVDDEEKALGMSDVGEGRQVLFSLLPEEFDLLAEQAAPLGRALGLVHGGTRGGGTPRPATEEAMIRGIVFQGLLAPGARAVFPELWDEVSAEMQAHNQCLIHADLWSKNLLVRRGEPVAVVDFEGVCYGDPAFDLGTLLAVSLVPALDAPALVPDALGFASRLFDEWAAVCGSDEWPAEVRPRAFRATATFLASRGFGPFAYNLSDGGRARVAALASTLAAEPPSEMDDFKEAVARHAAGGGSREAGARAGVTTAEG
ncbi:MAG TPA: aminoglycoside phosphotransferase family protein [Pyrinomonadaceae bacterium]|jgi:aminoglycoside phosphotransferase (APT) family kinase protein